ncbi:MAG: hypothetical protein LBL86_01650 [Coriobacteriales bacterium]|jgi:hypothetical protein|nr:hypothetical protein [Coriobacteriales bacterium]
MDYAFWIAAIGCLTGVLLLSIEIARYFSQRTRIEVTTIDPLKNVVQIDDDVTKCYLGLRIFNHGAKHLLLQDVYMRRPGRKSKKLNDFVHFSKAMTPDFPWKPSDGSLNDCKAEKVTIPVSIPPGGIFESVFLFIDMTEDGYLSEDRMMTLSVCAVFTPKPVRAVNMQAIVLASDAQLSFYDEDGNEWVL